MMSVILPTNKTMINNSLENMYTSTKGKKPADQISTFAADTSKKEKKTRRLNQYLCSTSEALPRDVHANNHL